MEEDAHKAVKNITTWLDQVLLPHKNKHGLRFSKFIAAEQEFNTYTYGIKGNIDSTLVMKDKEGVDLVTALEIKTGKHHSVSYRGQVMIYSLLIAERFINANPDNILLYIMEQPVANGFEYLKQQKLELDSLILGRNELAKWHKLNSMHIDLPRQYFQDKSRRPPENEAGIVSNTNNVNSAAADADQQN